MTRQSARGRSAESAVVCNVSATACELIKCKPDDSARTRGRSAESSVEQGANVGEVMCEHMRERIACNKAIALAKRSAKERTAMNRAAAIAKRLVQARKPSWNITTATDAHFGTNEPNIFLESDEPFCSTNEVTDLKRSLDLRGNSSSVGPSGLTHNKSSSSVGPSGLAHISEKAVENAFSNPSSSFPEFDGFFCDTKGMTEHSGSELTSPDRHPVLVKDNSPEGVSEPDSHNNICTTDPKQSLDHSKRNPTTHPNVPSEPVNFGDKRRRLISTPLFTGYYVSDRPPDGQTHNHSRC